MPDTGAAETHQDMTRGDRVLCLDGGGIRGLIMTEYLIELENALGDGVQIRDCFDWIGGTSTGGILAIALASGKSAKECKDLYWRMKDDVFRGDHPYDSEPLETLLKKEFGVSTKMTDLKYPKLIVTSVLADRIPTKLHLFRNYDPPAVDDDADDSDYGQFHPTLKPQDQLAWEAARCSGAAPTYFNPYGKYIDGGVMANNPTLDVLAEINEYNISNGRKFPERSLDVVLSLGTGDPKIQPTQPPVFYNPGSFSHSLHHPFQSASNLHSVYQLLLFFQSQATQTRRQTVRRSKNWCEMIGTPYFRFSPRFETAELTELNCKDDQRLNDMLTKTRYYMEEPQQQLEFHKLVEILKQRK